MATIRSDVRIARPPALVWAALVDAGRFTEWKQGVVSVDRVDGPLDRPGASYEATLAVLGRRLRGRFEMREVEAPVRLVQLGRVGSGTTVTTNIVRPLDEHSTRLDFELSYDLPAGPLGHVLDRLFLRRMLEREMERSHERLRELLERGDAP